jgi:hypothetical protein
MIPSIGRYVSLDLTDHLIPLKALTLLKLLKLWLRRTASYWLKEAALRVLSVYSTSAPLLMHIDAIGSGK